MKLIKGDKQPAPTVTHLAADGTEWVGVRIPINDELSTHARIWFA